jgi:TetR/AcrR family transcriptional regulator
MKVRREDFVTVARQLYETRGLGATTIADVAQELGVRRSLFYHYFKDKNALTTAVLNSYVDEYLESLSGWRDRQAVVYLDEAVLESVRIMRSYMFSSQSNSFLHSLGSSENAAYYIQFCDIVADRLSEFFVDTAVRSYLEEYDLDIKHVLDMYYLLIYGLVGFIRHHPDVSDEVLHDLVMQTLHMRPSPQKT